MPKITTLPIITSSTSATSFLIVDERVTRLFPYSYVVDEIINNLQETDLRGPTGPAGPASSIPGPTGPAGPAGTLGPGVAPGGTTGQVLVKLSNADYDTEWQTVSGSGGGSGIGLSSRVNVIGTSTTLTSGNTATIDISGFKTYVLSKVSTNVPAWVRIYSDTFSRSVDFLRSEIADPLPGAGVIAEVITSFPTYSQTITPAVVGFNGDTIPSSTVYVTVTNKDAASTTVTVTLTLLQLEA